MKKIIFILITLFVFSFSQRIYASNSGVFSDGKTIKNLKKDIESINKTKANLDSSLNTFLEEHKIDSYLKKWLSTIDYQNIQNIGFTYNSKIGDIEEKINRTEKDEELQKLHNALVESRKDLYKSLLPYIDAKSIKSYLNYVENSTKNFIEKNNLSLSQLKIQNNYSKKVEALEKKIQENKDYLDDVIKNLIEQKFDEKFSQFMEMPSFTKLSTSEKIKTLETVVERLNAKVDSLKTNMNYDSIYIESEKRKLEIYQVLIRKLNELAYSLK